jgi:hypothetical protein
MDQLAREFADQVQFLFVYVCEAHPKRYPEYPPHSSLEQKYRYATYMQHRHRTPRPILMDFLLGDAHRLHGGFPNMSWVIDHTGRVTYKAAWTVVEDVRDALEDVTRISEWKREASSDAIESRTTIKRRSPSCAEGSIPSLRERRKNQPLQATTSGVM